MSRSKQRYKSLAYEWPKTQKTFKTNATILSLPQMWMNMRRGHLYNARRSTPQAEHLHGCPQLNFLINALRLYHNQRHVYLLIISNNQKHHHNHFYRKYMMKYNRDAQPAARGPDPARERVLSGPRRNFKSSRNFSWMTSIVWKNLNFLEPLEIWQLIPKSNPKQLWHIC